MMEHKPLDNAEEIERGDRFRFGENWRRFLGDLDEQRIAQAVRSLQEKFGVESLSGSRFLDIGSGSGLFSLAARRLGATVTSFDYDPESVACTTEVRRRYEPEGASWSIGEGSVLDPGYLRSLGQFDRVYSWGVLHHTGRMWEAVANVVPLVEDGGVLFIAIYNDQGWISRYWSQVKRLYNSSTLGRFVVVMAHIPYLLVLRHVVRAVSGRTVDERGMSLWHDMFDWLGGYPFEVARPEQVLDFLRARGFVLERLKTCGGRMGCNEFVFRKSGRIER